MLLVVVAIVIMVAVVMAPRPVFLLFFRSQLAEVAITVAMGFVAPATIVDDFIVVPAVIVGVVRIVNSIRMMLRAGQSCQ